MILTLAAALLSLAYPAVGAVEKLPKVSVYASNNSYHNCAISEPLPKRYHHLIHTSIILESKDKTEKIPGQIVLVGKNVILHFVVSDIAAGIRKTYDIHKTKLGNSNGVQLAEVKGDMEVSIGNSLFTKYTTHSGPNKPFFYPFLTPGGLNLTRQWPVEDIATDTHDHPHHRGLWFTHGNVNGVDFWAETPGTGKTVTTGYHDLVSGPVFGSFVTTTDWINPDGSMVGTDVRTVRITPFPNGDRILDFDIEFTPNGKTVTFGDTKEGMFGLRTTDTLAPSRKLGGHMINSEGLKDAECWGKKAAWVDYFGQVGGKTYGISMFDTASNLRHPQTWHARDYGLFTINPFGLHDFGMGEKGAGDYVVAADKKLSLKYRVFFHKGDTEAGGVVSQYHSYADPPKVSIQ